MHRNNLLDKTDEIPEIFNSSLSEGHNYLTIEDRLLKISETVNQLNSLTEEFEQHYYVSV